MTAEERSARLKPVVSYPRDAVVDVHQVAAGLGVGPGVVKKMDLPFFMAGGRERWVWGQVLDTLTERAAKFTNPTTRARKTA